MKTNPLRVLVVEDEMLIAAKISLNLEQLGYDVAGILPRGEEVLPHCQQAAPDLLLLDINLKGSTDGVDTAQSLRENGFDLPIVYLTANVDDASFERARATRPFAFIGKPFKRSELSRTLALVAAHLRETEAAIETVATEAPAPDAPYRLDDRIFVRHKDRLVKLFLHDILYAEADRSYCHIHTPDQVYTISATLKRVEAQLGGGPFLRVHRSTLINLDQIDAVGDQHVVIQGKAIGISAAYRSAFAERVRLMR